MIKNNIYICIYIYSHYTNIYIYMHVTKTNYVSIFFWLATNIEALRANGPAGLIHDWHQPAIAEPVASGRPARRHLWWHSAPQHSAVLHETLTC